MITALCSFETVFLEIDKNKVGEPQNSSFYTPFSLSKNYPSSAKLVRSPPAISYAFPNKANESAKMIHLKPSSARRIFFSRNDLYLNNFTKIQFLCLITFVFEIEFAELNQHYDLIHKINFTMNFAFAC